ncbi:MAG: thymidine kinase [Metamycoplasmataceae bacterium]
MYQKLVSGNIEIITGPMFSGKSAELIRRITILSYAELKTLVIKHSYDDRFSANEITSRNGDKISSFLASSTNDIRKLFNSDYKFLVIDEAQFFDDDLYDFIVEISNKGTNVIISGLDQDFQRKPFPLMANLMSIADVILKLKAVCLICKSSAGSSFRKNKSRNLWEVGDTQEYEARCKFCHQKGEEKKKIKTS